MVLTAPDAPVIGLAKAIHLSVAPVFLLTGISGLLGVLSNRLARIIDRANVLQEAEELSDISGSRRLRLELGVQKQRIGLINRAITCCTLTALLVSLVVAVVFISAVAWIDLAPIVVPLFVVAMLSLMGALLLLLREVQLATNQVRRRF
ncbi:DUF2721 domain-containing protein [Cyanobium sp. Morenito 9A2]|uniref:DUF2721 domain-containing protein n=1 Tax=Cyanobium sp. Morenito 9A2 TaxID=2823718 RepID=UPI0020CEF05A|nr:DUF2721 domain-containing protein [Cyanobium sp. Morenito 9A2]